MRRIGVQFDPAIASRIIPRNRIPGVGQFPPLRRNREIEPERSKTPIRLHTHGLFQSGHQVCHRQSGRSDRCDSQISNGKAGQKAISARYAEPLERFIGQPKR
ncbi:hypothetical protein SPYCA_3241 [Sphingopyxis sp. FD7]|nr:hypothetical protein SPYCA_3241 [Sphingopyxis sp. FD7]